MTERKTMRGITRTASLIFLLIIVPLTPLAAQTASYMISWAPNPEPEVDGYVIFRSLTATTGFEAIDSVDAATTTYVDTDLEQGTFYFYRLKAKDADGNRGLFSNLVSGMTIPQDADATMNSLCEITDIQAAGTWMYRIRKLSPCR
jgi:fibronectin type 3 domain-containing protein